MPNSVVGPQSVADGQVVNSRLGRTGESVITALHGRYYESCVRGGLFSGSIVGQVTTVGLATTYTGLCLSNPITSPVNLSINKVGVGFLVAFGAAASIGMMVGYNATTNVTHTTPVTPRPQRFLGQASVGQGLLDSSATLPTAPILNMIFGAGFTGAITTEPCAYSLFDVDGSIVLPPGGYAAIYTSTASGTASMSASIQWEEIAP